MRQYDRLQEHATADPNKLHSKFTLEIQSATITNHYTETISGLESLLLIYAHRFVMAFYVI